MPDVPFPRGVRDLLPNEALFREELLTKIIDTYRRFGYLPIDTPAFESLKVLQAKDAIGEDAKLIYEMKHEDVALRYDFTVSLARYFAMHSDLQLPFKRYAVGKVWRREEPQRMRYREFTQADIDVIGGRVPAVDAEVIAVPALIFDSLDIGYRILINSRKFVDAMLKSVGIKPELFAPVTRAIDKLDKIGRDGVLEHLQKLGLDSDAITKITAIISMEGTNEEKLAHAEQLMEKKEPCAEIRETLGTLAEYGAKGEAVIDFSLVRGLDYYTGIVFEFKPLSGEKSTIASGGRYDNLIELYGKRQVSASGSSIGVDRILDTLNFSASTKRSFASIMIATIKDSNYVPALRLARLFRNAGISVDLNLASRNLSNQLSYANALGFKYVAIVGDEEEKLGKVKLRNLLDGSESLMDVDGVIYVLTGKRAEERK